MAVETEQQDDVRAAAVQGGAGAPAAKAERPAERQRPASARPFALSAALARLWRKRLRRLVVISPLTRRILILNIVVLASLVIGLNYLGEYQRSLIASELDSLTSQARIFAGALGESAVGEDPMASNEDGLLELLPDQSRMLLRRLIEPTKARARLFSSSGALIADSRFLMAPGGVVQIETLPPPEPETMGARLLDRGYRWLVKTVPSLGKLPRYRELPHQQASDYAEVAQALVGVPARVVYDNRPRGLILSVAVPVQRYKRVVGALMVSQGSSGIDAAMRSIRLDILKAFGVALLITTVFSFYLGSTIVKPIRRLAAAAERLGPGRRRSAEIPDFSGRGDEIGDLSAALRRMTEQLRQRMDAIERFAADVAHEIKNPLSSLRSAVETAARVKDPEQQRRLMAIIVEDVHRLDRLISDISDASRLDAELSRAAAERVDLHALLAALVEVYGGDERSAARPRLALAWLEREQVFVRGIEGRLAQVFRNLIENAISFSPPAGIIALSVRPSGRMVEALVEDEGPGLPEGKFEAIFERFYTERPAGEKFGIHSGLGLSISKQIVEAHGGSIRAENRRDRTGRVVGARFIVRLPLESEEEEMQPPARPTGR